eukprot:gene31301-40672_t
MNTAHMQGAVAEEVNRRLARATGELQDKYASGATSYETSVDGPSGAAYKEKEAKEKKERKERNRLKKEDISKSNDAPVNSQQGDDDEELDEDNGDDEDYELRLIREQRLKQIKNSHLEKVQNIGKGHGQYREIVQDEFLAEVTSSDKVIVHFYHRDFPRCEIMHMHLQKLAHRHIESKFLKINAEKAMFFVEKLKVRSMPTVVIFHDGVAIDKIIGFDGLADGMPEGKEDEWRTVTLAKLLASKKAIKKELIVDEDGEAANFQEKLDALRKNAFVKYSNLDADDDLQLSD